MAEHVLYYSKRTIHRHNVRPCVHPVVYPVGSAAENAVLHCADVLFPKGCALPAWADKFAGGFAG